MRQNSENLASDIINTSWFADLVAEGYQEAAKGVTSAKASKCLPNNSWLTRLQESKDDETHLIFCYFMFYYGDYLLVCHDNVVAH